MDKKEFNCAILGTGVVANEMANAKMRYFMKCKTWKRQ